MHSQSLIPHRLDSENWHAIRSSPKDDTSDQNGKPSTPPNITSRTSTIITTRQNFHLAISTSGALLASQPTILFWFEQNCIFASSFFYFWVWICPNMLHFYVLFICHLFIPLCSQRLSRAIHWLIFNRLAGTQFVDSISWHATNHFVLVWTETACYPVQSL